MAICDLLSVGSRLWCIAQSGCRGTDSVAHGPLASAAACRLARRRPHGGAEYTSSRSAETTMPGTGADPGKPARAVSSFLAPRSSAQAHRQGPGFHRRAAPRARELCEPQPSPILSPPRRPQRSLPAGVESRGL